MLPSDKVYPLFSKDLQSKLNLNSYEIQCILWKLKIKEKQKYHSEIKTSGKTKCHKYSETLLTDRILKKSELLKKKGDLF